MKDEPWRGDPLGRIRHLEGKLARQRRRITELERPHRHLGERPPDSAAERHGGKRWRPTLVVEWIPTNGPTGPLDELLAWPTFLFCLGFALGGVFAVACLWFAY